MQQCSSIMAGWMTVQRPRAATPSITVLRSSFLLTLGIPAEDLADNLASADMGRGCTWAEQS